MLKRRSCITQPACAVVRVTTVLSGTLAVLAVSAHADAPATPKIAPENQTDALLWGEQAKGIVNSATQKQFADAATTQISMLAELRTWRDTFNGTGSKAQRNLIAGELGGQKASLLLGNVSPPSLAGFGGAGLAARWGAFEVGSTYRPRAFDEALREWDETMSGQKLNLSEQQHVTWLRAKPWQTKTSELELSVARASRDMAAGKATKWRDGTFLGGKGKLALPNNWKANGEWNLARLDDGNEAHSSWRAQTNGPIEHPWGTARASAEWRDVEAGYGNLTSQNQLGERGGRADVTQDMKIGALTGKFQVGAAQSELDDYAAAHNGAELATRNAVGSATLRYSVTKNVAVRAEAKAVQTEIQRAAGETTSVADDIREQIQNAGGDVGLEWKLTKGLSVAALVGRSDIESQRQLAGSDSTPISETLPGQEEERLSLEIKHQGQKSQLGVRFTARDRDTTDFVGPESPWTRVDTLRLEAGRKIGGLNIKTLLNLARDRDALDGTESGLARHAEAQLQFSKAARIDLRYRDGAAVPNDWWRDPLGARLGSNFNSGDSEFGARINTGSAAGGSGFGLSFEYARNQSAGADTDTWKMGLTYR